VGDAAEAVCLGFEECVEALAVLVVLPDFPVYDADAACVPDGFFFEVAASAAVTVAVRPRVDMTRPRAARRDNIGKAPR
jgi:hypothetical protein